MARPAPGDRLRAATRRAVLALLAAEGPLSRADIGRRTGLARSTVSVVVAELLRSGEAAVSSDRGVPHKGGSGRPPVLLEIATPPGTVAGVDIGHRHVRVLLADRGGSLLAEGHAEVDVDPSGSGSLDLAAAMVRRLAEQERDAGPLLAAGLCVPAPVDATTGRIGSGVLRGWRGLAPAAELRERLAVPVRADNDANLGALAELHHGAGRGTGDLVYVTVASGLGAGVVLGGRLQRGASGIAGEIGHVQVDEDGALCRCGNRGCLETRVSAPRLLEQLQPAYDERLSAARVRELDALGDPGVARVLADAGRAVGRVVADLCNVLNPGAVVLGGVLGATASTVAGTREAIDRFAQPGAASAVRVVAGELGDRAEALGAVALANARLAHHP
ncbi:ROK family protein [Nocardioides sp. zg-DK7169]|uniref:ROK family transcriptional regulator n=1 Tax=Nocardioides sp. zg-DK7169 TaxID=2736600 RepID=UPI001552814C|nr:ROK family protein [Nocardioides sp. zg-DK7169]NPC95558.1 ROK family transcriptional regulator [Nocardioides sp. zg-DK7169]